MEDTKEEVIENTTKPSKSKSSGWRERIFEMDLFSPIYIFLFILLFKDGIDGYDLHDAFIKFITTYNGS